jgi:hypothetical protein
LKAIAPQVRPGDTVQFTIREEAAGALLPAGVTVRGAPGSGTSIIFGKRNGMGLGIAGGPGLDTPTRIENLRFRVGSDAPPRMLHYPHGVSLNGSRAELTGCTFDAGLSAGIYLFNGAQARVHDCRFGIAGGKGVLVRGHGSTVEVENSIFTKCGEGVVGEGGTTIACRDVTFQDLTYHAVRINGRYARSVVVENCRMLGMRDGASLRVLDSAVVRGCTIDVRNTALAVEGMMPVRRGNEVTTQTRAKVTIEKNVVRKAAVGVKAKDVADCVVSGNKLTGIDYVGVQLDCPATVENNHVAGTKRPSDYAPPRFDPAWRIGTMGVLIGIDRAEPKPTIRNNSLLGCSRWAIVLVGGAEATTVENRFDKSLTEPVGRPTRGSSAARTKSREAWRKARAQWEQRQSDK